MSSFSTKTVLVTGASGFIGTHLCRALRAQGAEVHGISRRARTDDLLCQRWWQADMADMTAIREVFRCVRPELVFHLASRVAGGRGIDMVLSTFHCNLASTVNLLIAATEANCGRIVLAGSFEEPGPHEPHPVPASPYAAAKLASSGYARMFHALYKTPIVQIRLFMVYGPEQQDLTKLIPYVTLSLLRKEQPKLSSGKRPVDWIYVADVVDGLLAAGHAAGVDGRTIDLGSGVLVPIHDVVSGLVRVVGHGTEPLFGAIPDRPMEQVRVANTTASFDSLGWKPTTPLEDGLAETVKWYRHSI